MIVTVPACPSITGGDVCLNGPAKESVADFPLSAVKPGEIAYERVQNRRMERLRLLGAAAGAVFAVVIVAAFAFAPGPSSAADVQVINYYTEHGNAAIWQAVLAGFGLVCFV